jgi:mannose-6-phosphate isomerase-like protein (cupin superfamily)
MRLVDASHFTADRAWGALDLARIPDATVRLHWTDQPYEWHVNDGTEAFAVLDGVVDMHVRDGDTVTVHELRPGRVFIAEVGDEHVAHPRGAARILVVEQAGSV